MRIVFSATILFFSIFIIYMPYLAIAIIYTATILGSICRFLQQIIRYSTAN